MRYEVDMEIYSPHMMCKVIPDHEPARAQQMLVVLEIGDRVEVVTVDEEYVNGVLREYIEYLLPDVF